MLQISYTIYCMYVVCKTPVIIWKFSIYTFYAVQQRNKHADENW